MWSTIILGGQHDIESRVISEYGLACATEAVIFSVLFMCMHILFSKTSTFVVFILGPRCQTSGTKS